MFPLVKPGVILDGVHPWLMYAAQVYDWLHRTVGLGQGTITGGREGPDAGPASSARLAGSDQHARGTALDFRHRTIPARYRPLFAQHLRNNLGPAFVVALESDHYHVALSAAALAYLEDLGSMG